MSGSSGWAQAMRFFWPTSSTTPGTGRRIIIRSLSTAAWVHSWMVAPDDSYWTMVLMPRAFHLAMEPLGWDQAPMTKKSGPATALGRLVMSAKSFALASAADEAVRVIVRSAPLWEVIWTRIGSDSRGASLPLVV